MNDQVSSVPSRSSSASTATIAADPRYVPEIIGTRPTVSKSRPSSSGPMKLLSANSTMKYGTLPEATSKNWLRIVPRSNVTAL